MEIRESMFSQPRGSPASSPGNSSGIIRIRRPVLAAWAMAALYRAKLRGVVMMETVRPRWERSLPKSVKGMMWLCDMSGMRRKWRGWGEGDIGR